MAISNSTKYATNPKTIPIPFDNVQEMIDYAFLEVGDKVRTLGYYSHGDGGGNDYEIVASGTGTGDGGSYIDLSGSGLQAKGLFHGGINVVQFGADESPADSTAAFQAVVDYMPGYGGEVNILDDKSYSLTPSSVNTGVKTIVWRGSSIVNGSGNFNILPGITRGLNRNYNTAESEPLLQEVINRNETSKYNGSAIRLRANANYTAAAEGGVSSTLQVQRSIGSNANNIHFNVISDVTTDQGDSGSQAAGIYSKVTKGAAAEGKVWGMAISAISHSTVDSQVVGMECNARAVGPMGAGNFNRIGLNCIVSTVKDEEKADFESIITCAVNGSVSGSTGVDGTTGELTADSRFGIKINEESPGQITNAGLLVETTGFYGIRTRGTKSIAEIRIEGDSPWGVDMISASLTSGAMRIGQEKPIRFTESEIVETVEGLFAISHQGDNKLTIDDSVGDPIKIMVDGSLKTVTQGAVDSAGAGFRQLRVPN